MRVLPIDISLYYWPLFWSDYSDFLVTGLFTLPVNCPLYNHAVFDFLLIAFFQFFSTAYSSPSLPRNIRFVLRLVYVLCGINDDYFFAVYPSGRIGICVDNQRLVRGGSFGAIL